MGVCMGEGLQWWGRGWREKNAQWHNTERQWYSRDSEAYRGPRTLQQGRAALPLTGSSGEHIHTWNSKKEHALCYTHTHTLVHVLMSAWDVMWCTGNMTRVKENISFGHFRCSKRPSCGVCYVRACKCVTALVMENIHCDVLGILAAVKCMVYLTVDIIQIK